MELLKHADRVGRLSVEGVLQGDLDGEQTREGDGDGDGEDAREGEAHDLLVVGVLGAAGRLVDDGVDDGRREEAGEYEDPDAREGAESVRRAVCTWARGLYSKGGRE